MRASASVSVARSPSLAWALLAGVASVASCHDGATKGDVTHVEPDACTALSDAGIADVHAHDVLTQHNDVARTGATLSESVLDTCSVPNLTKLGEYAVDGEVYAQPLYVADVATPAGAKDLLIVATMADSLYAFDAGLPGSAPVWQLGSRGELGAPAFSARNVAGNNGILATPVIDVAADTVFVSSRDCDPAYRPEVPHCKQRLFDIALDTGKIRRSVDIAGSVSNASGSSATFFDPSLHWARAGLLLRQGRLFVSFGSGPNGNAHEEDFPFHGWLFGYTSSNLEIAPSVYCSTPELGGGAIWQSGNAPAADDDAVYFATGNGIHQPTPVAPAGFPTVPEGDEDSLVRVPLAAPSTSLHFWDGRAYRADGNVFQYMEKNDIDLGTAGPLLIPGTSQLIAAGKSGIIYVLDRTTLRPTQDPLEVFHGPSLAAGQTKYIFFYDGGPHVHGSPVFVRPNDATDSPGPGLLFYWPAHEPLTSFSYEYATGTLSPLATASVPRPDSGGILAASADGTRADSAIVWASTVDPDGTSGHLWALSATTLNRLWDTKLPAWAKFATPTVAAGRVYLASSSSKPNSDSTVQVFGLAQ